MTIHSNRIHLIENTDDLTAAAARLKQSPEISVDTESDSLFAYFSKVCLIQISANHENYVIDPLETMDLSCLGELFADPKILKIFHAGEYDLMCLKRDYGFSFVNLFDTMLASRILGKPAIGLGPLIENEFGIHMNKKYQKANWGQRPLSMEMLEYGAMDTCYLSELKDLLQRQLEEQHLTDFAEEDFLRLCQTPAGLSEPAEINWWNVAGGEELLPQEIGILQKLCVMRDLSARRRDLPPFKVISNQTLLEISRKMPRTEHALYSISGLNQGMIRRYGKDILEAVKTGKNAKDTPMPKQQQKPPNGVLQRRDRLKEWRKQKGIDLSLPSDVILPKDVMMSIASVGPSTQEELKELMADCPVRYAHFHDEILQESLRVDPDEENEE